MVKLLRLLKKDFAICALLLLFSPLFFFKLGQSSLQNWDEAWYAEISRNILKTGDFLNMTWSGKPYFDHPSFGFVMTAISFKFLGVSEFSARFMSALFGLISIILIYLLGKELFSRWVGLFCAVALPSATWFLYRARSGNLDVYLETMFLLTFFLAFKANQNKKFLIPFTISLSCLFLTKTMVPFTALPSLAVVFWGNRKITKEEINLNVFIFLLIAGSWFITQQAHQIGFLQRYFNVGLPGVEVKTDLPGNIRQAKEYLHNGIGKWFWPGIVSLFLSIPLRQKRFLFLTVFFLSFMVPFVFSSNGGIWHLIPLHPVLILAFFGLAYTLIEKLSFPPLGWKREYSKILGIGVLFLVSIYFSFIQIKRSWYEFIDINPEISSETILSKEAARFSEDLYIEGSDFRPDAVFYSGKNVPQRLYEGDLAKFFAANKDFLLITYQRELDDQKIPPSSYRILAKESDKILVFKEN